jgi:hypothetical protein
VCVGPSSLHSLLQKRHLPEGGRRASSASASASASFNHASSLWLELPEGFDTSGDGPAAPHHQLPHAPAWAGGRRRQVDEPPPAAWQQPHDGVVVGMAAVPHGLTVGVHPGAGMGVGVRPLPGSVPTLGLPPTGPAHPAHPARAGRALGTQAASTAQGDRPLTGVSLAGNSRFLDNFGSVIDVGPKRPPGAGGAVTFGPGGGTADGGGRGGGAAARVVETRMVPVTDRSRGSTEWSWSALVSARGADPGAPDIALPSHRSSLPASPVWEDEDPSTARTQEDQQGRLEGHQWPPAGGRRRAGSQDSSLGASSGARGASLCASLCALQVAWGSTLACPTMRWWGLGLLCCAARSLGPAFPFVAHPLSNRPPPPPSPLQTVPGEVKSRTQGLPRTAAARAVGRAVVAPLTPSTSGRCWSATRPACVVLRPWRLGCRRTVGPPVTHPSGRNGGTPYAAQVQVQV